MMGRLQHEVAARPIHPIEHDHVADALEAMEALGPTRIEHDGADRLGFARILRAVLASFPRGANASDVIERRIEPFRQFGGDFALAQAKCLSSGPVLTYRRGFFAT